MISFEQREDVAPVCPYCKKEIVRVWYRELKCDLGKKCLYFCSECKSTLGVSHRKGLTFGW